jgi:hypothetical protein
MTLRSSREREKGSVVLVALCFLAVLGLALASYLAVSHQAVKLSNREYQRSISLQLAESGIEQSLWSFNWNNWSAWDTSLIPRSAIRQIFFPPDKYNNGVVGSIMLRVDRYDATVWNNFTTYTAATHDLVWYHGVWYQCITDDVENPPTDGPSAKWRAAPALWNASANYQAGNIVLYGGSAYVCISPNINTLPTDTTKWSSPTAVGNWNGALNYAADNVVLFGGMSYRCVVANSNKSPPDASYWVGPPAIYADGIATPPDNPAGAIRTQLLALVVPAPLFPNAIGATTTVTLTSTSGAGIVDSYNSLLGSYPSPGPNSNVATGFSATVAGGNTAGAAVKVSGGTVQGYVSAPPGLSSPYYPNVNLAGTLKGAPAGTGIDGRRIGRSPNTPQFDSTRWDSTKTYRPYDVMRAPDGYLYICSTTNINQPPPNAVWSRGTLIVSGAQTIGNSGSAYPLLYHVDGDLALPNATDVLTIAGPVILDVAGNISIDNGLIQITSTGSAEILFAGQLKTENNTGSGIDNTITKDPKRLLLARISSTGTTAPYFHSPIKFYGAIYMPQCLMTLDLTALGSGIYGAIAADRVSIPDRLRVHYDTALRTTSYRSIDSPFTVTEWRELTDPAEKIVLP